MTQRNQENDSLISIVIPTKNRLSYLREAIASVYAQTYQNFEIIVVDDGSSGPIEPHMQAYDERLRFFRQPPQGAAAARNHGIAVAKGAFIAFLDDDDSYLPDKLQNSVDCFALHPEIAWLCTGFSFVDASGADIARQPILPEDRLLHAHDIALFTFISTSTIMVRTQNLKEAGGFDEGMTVSEDYALWAKLVLQSPCGTVPKVLATFRLHKGNTALPYRRLLNANTRIIDMLMNAAGDTHQPRAVYVENLHRIIADSLWYKRQYVQYACFALWRKLRHHSTT